MLDANPRIQAISGNGMLEHAIAVAAGAAGYLAAARLDPFTIGRTGAGSIAPIAVAVAVALMIATDTSLRVFRAPHGPRARTVAMSLAPLHLSIASAAALFLMAEPVIGGAAYPLLLAPLAATHHAFRQLSRVRKTFDQTVESLSRVPEIAGYSHPGHSERVRELSTATGKALRLSDKELAELAVAASMHDLGRMQAPSPESVASIDAAMLAAGSASVVRATGMHELAARIIEDQHADYRDQHGRVTSGLHSGSQIVRVASMFDDLTATGPGAHSSQEALEILERGRGSRLDPAVLDAFRSVVTTTVS